MQQWEFAFVSANGRKPSFMERREDAMQVRRATELIELRQRSASLHRVLSAVNSYTIRDGLLEAKQPAVLAALALFLSVDVNHDGRVAEDELEPCASMPLPRASWWPSEHPSCHPVCIQAAHLCSRRKLPPCASTLQPHASQVTEKEFARLASSELPRLQGDSRGTTFTHEQLQRTFAKADLNGDGEIDFNEFFLWLSGGAKGESRNVSPDLHRASISSPLGGAAEGAAGGTAGGSAPIEGRKELDERLLKETDRRHVHGWAWAWATMRLHAHAHDGHAHAHVRVHVHIMQPWQCMPMPTHTLQMHMHTCACTETCTCTRTLQMHMHARARARARAHARGVPGAG